VISALIAKEDHVADDAERPSCDDRNVLRDGARRGAVEPRIVGYFDLPRRPPARGRGVRDLAGGAQTRNELRGNGDRRVTCRSSA
jgi:hypothetical protein